MSPTTLAPTPSEPTALRRTVTQHFTAPSSPPQFTYLLLQNSTAPMPAVPSRNALHLVPLNDNRSCAAFMLALLPATRSTLLSPQPPDIYLNSPTIAGERIRPK